MQICEKVTIFSADSNYNITISTKATLHYSGEVIWEPPAIFKKTLLRDGIQFGSWTYSEDLLVLELLDGEPHYELETNEFGEVDNITIVDDGIDLSDYYPSVEWDIMSRVAIRRTKNYPSCCPQSDAYIDIMVDSGEKVTLCISILVALTVFFLLLTEIIPATSISLPLIGKYLLFTMVMVTLSVVVTVICEFSMFLTYYGQKLALNLHFRTPTTHRMPEWVKWLFLKFLPKVLFMRRPLADTDDRYKRVSQRRGDNCEKVAINYHEHRVSRDIGRALSTSPIDERIQKLYYSPAVMKAFENKKAKRPPSSLSLKTVRSNTITMNVESHAS
uniref:Neurotransmitter-gated ion-channel ligand-binding domain-containing protein n=1 Tax=Parascaris equorum TaxID=6256 RepID=A0A914S096_PAREQ